MQTSNRRSFLAGLAGLAAVLASFGLWSCGSSSTCLRYSDCDQGLTCYDGACVVPGHDTSDGGDDGGGESSSTSTGSMTVEDGAATTDSGIADASTD